MILSRLWRWRSPAQPTTSFPRRRWSFAHVLATARANILPWVSIALLAILLIVPGCLLVWLVFFTNNFTVQAITVLDARPHTTDATKEVVEKHVSRTPFNRNIFFVQSDVIAGDIQSTLPQVFTAYVTRQLPGTIKVIIQEKNPALLLLSNTHYYFVDEKGIVYEEARLDTLPGIVLPTLKNTDQEAEVTLGVPVVDSSFVDFIQHIQEHLPGVTNAAVAEIRIPSLSAREVHFLLDNNWEVRFDVTRPPGPQLETLRQLLATTISPEEQTKLEYIDLRIQNRVYYRTTSAPVAATPTPPKPTDADTE